MNKDVIYIDVEDDITAIIGKVKASKEKVVALVPPKRIGVLQSAVNLRLLARAAKQTDKHLALVTNNHALIALATSASIPVAKNLQTKPEMAEVPALEVDDGEDIIEGATLPVGDHAGQATSADDAKEAKGAAMAAALAEAPTGNDAPKKPKVKSPKVPNFSKFRKKLILIVAGAVLLLSFLVWAIFFAPRATVVIKARTTPTSVNEQVTISTGATTSLDKNTLKAISKEKTDEKSVEFQATGKKDAGKKATGAVQFSNRRGASVSVPAGTSLTASGLEFVVDSAVTIPGATVCPDRPAICPGTAEGSVTAAENGSKYNAATGNLSGVPGGAAASFTDATSGGVSKMVTIVTAGDVQKAKESLAESDTDAIRGELKDQFSSAVAIEESFRVEYKGTDTSVAVGEEAEKVTLTTEVVYRLYGVEAKELDTYLDAYLAKELGKTNDQRVYTNGSNKVVFQEARRANNGARATLIATAQVGPKIDDDEVKTQAKGKRFGEIQQSLEAIQGVDSVDVQFFPFWVSTVPNDEGRITIKFDIDESN